MSHKRTLLGTLFILLIAFILFNCLAFGSDIRPTYKIEVRLDPDNHILDGKETINFKNVTEKSFQKLYLHLYPNRFMDDKSIYAREKGVNNWDMIFPDGPDSGFTLIDELTVDGQTTSYTINDTIMRIDFKKPLQPGVEVQLSLKFRVKIPHGQARFGYHQGNYYISWWYPRLATYDSCGWHPYQVSGTFPNEPYDNFASYTVKITVPQRMVVGATGILEGVIQDSDGTKTMNYSAEKVHDFAWVADKNYRVETVIWKDVTIHSLYFPKDQKAGKRAARFAKDAIAYFSQLFGKYPYSNYTVAEVRMAGGAMEYPQLIMQSNQLYGLPKFLTILEEATAHETAHQWFYGMLMNDQVNEAWLDEGFATFCELSYMQKKHGGTYILDRKTLKEVPIIGSYLNKRLISSHILDIKKQVLLQPYLQAAKGRTEESLLTPKNKIRPGKRPLVYQKGALLLFNLRYLVGKETFREIMRTYFKRYKFKKVTTQDFVQVSEQVSGRDLKWFFEEWLETAKKLDYVLQDVVEEKISDQFITRAIVLRKGELKMPVEIQVTLEDNKGKKKPEKIIKRFWPVDQRAVFTFVTDRPVKSVVIDPQEILPDLDGSNNQLSTPLEFSPLIESGMMKGRKEDGLILGINFRGSETNIGGKLAYAKGIEKFIYDFRLGPPLQPRLMKFVNKGRGLDLRFNLTDNGHIFTANLGAGFHFSTWISDIVNYSNYLEIKPYYHDLYRVAGDQGILTGISINDDLTFTSKKGLKGSVGLNYKGSYEALGGDFDFNKYSFKLKLSRRVSWNTYLSARFFNGFLFGKTPNNKGKFGIKENGHFRTFKRKDDAIAVLNSSLKLPIPSFSKITLGPIPIFIHLEIFGDLGWFGRNFKSFRSDGGWGLSFGPPGLEGLFKLEQVLWVNTEKNMGKPGFNFGISFEM